MRLVTSMMTTTEMSDEHIKVATDILLNQFCCTNQIYKYKFEERKFYEVDIDIFDIVFSKEKIYEDIGKLIFSYEMILQSIPYTIDFIVANDDTESFVLQYEKNQNNIWGFGLFVTRRKIPNIEPYYSSEICNAYLNFEHVSFGVMF